MDCKREKVIIYPYGSEFAPLMRHSKLLSKYEVIAAVSPKGWGLNNMDAGFADRGTDIGIIVTSDFQETLEKCDTLIVADCEADERFIKIIFRKIEDAIDKGKNIICTLPLDSIVVNEYITKCSQKGIYFKYLACNHDLDRHPYDIQDECIEGISVPVIFVLGLGEKTNKFEIQLSLREGLMNKGYKISQVGTRNYCDLAGVNPIPGFIYETGISEVHKIVLFNRFIKEIENRESPDVIIIGIPGGIMPFNSKITNKFGIIPYMISQAVIPDFSVVSVYYEDYETKYFDMLSKSIRYKLGFEVDCFNIANNQIDWGESATSKEIVCSSAL